MMKQRVKIDSRDSTSRGVLKSLRGLLAPGDGGDEMDFAIGLQLRPQTARRHDSVDGNLQRRTESTVFAKSRFDTGKALLKFVNHFANRVRFALNRFHTAG